MRQIRLEITKPLKSKRLISKNKPYLFPTAVLQYFADQFGVKLEAETHSPTASKDGADAK